MKGVLQMISKEKFMDTYVKENTVVWCKTEKLTSELLEVADRFGLKWTSGERYIGENNWELSCKSSCYYLYLGQYSRLEWYKRNGYNIIEFKGFDNMKFTKDDLRTGHIVTLRTGDKYTVIKDSVLNEDVIVSCENKTKWNRFSDYADDLTTRYDKFDIMKIETPTHAYGLMGIKNYYNNVELVWEREEVKKMTLEEVCEELGYDIEIVKGV